MGDVLISLQNNTFSRADLSNESGVAKNVHYGDVLIKFGEVLDVSKEQLPMILDESVLTKYKASFLQNGDVIVADTAEDSTVGKCSEIAGLNDEVILSGLHTIPYRPAEKFATGYLGYYLNSCAYHNQLIPLMQGIKVTSISKSAMQDTDIVYPKLMEEQTEIGNYFYALDHLITLHQCKCHLLLKLLHNDWEQRKLNEYFNVSTAKNKDNHYGKEDVLSVSGDYGIVNQIKFQGRSFAGATVANYGVVNTGDVVYTKSPLSTNPYGIIKANKGKAGIVSTLYAVYKPCKNVNSEFVQVYFELNSRMNNYMQPLVNKGAKNDMKVTAENALKGGVCFPKLNEQNAIVEYFRSLDHLITLHQRKCEETKKLKKYMLQKMFPQNGQTVPEIRFSGFTDAWEQRKFGDLGSVAMCKRIFKEQTSTDGDIPFYKIGTFGAEPDAFISRELFEEYRGKFQYPNIGDMLISASGTIGRTVEYKGEEAYFQDSNIVWFKHDDRVDNSFLKCIYEIVKWSGIEGSTIKRLYNDNFLKTEFSMPKVAEQQQIGMYFQSLDHLITLHQYKCEQLQSMKKFMLQNMFV